MKQINFIILFLVALASYSQQPIKGRVVDGKTGQGVPYAAIYYQVDTHKAQTNANENGLFSFTPIGEVFQKARVTAAGYADKYIDIPTTADELTVKLTPNLYTFTPKEMKVKGKNIRFGQLASELQIQQGQAYLRPVALWFNAKQGRKALSLTKIHLYAEKSSQFTVRLLAPKIDTRRWEPYPTAAFADLLSKPIIIEADKKGWASAEIPALRLPRTPILVVIAPITHQENLLPNISYYRKVEVAPLQSASLSEDNVILFDNFTDIPAVAFDFEY